MSSSLINVITYYQQSIEKHGQDEKRLLHCIEKLYRLPIKLEHLQTTGVGKTVNSLRKYDREVGVAAKALVAKWKAMVAAEAQVEEEEEDDDIHDAYDDDEDNDGDNDNSPGNNNNTQTDSENNKACENEERSSHHSKQERSPSSNSNKNKSENMHESHSKSKSHEHRSHGNHSSSRHKHGEHKHEKHKKSSRGEHRNSKRSRHEEYPSRAAKDSDEEKSVMNSPKMSIVDAIEQDFEVLEDDDEEKLIIDVSKEKTEEMGKTLDCESQNLIKSRHHSSKDNSKKDSYHRKEESHSREKSSKESSRSKDSSKKERKHSKEDTKQEISTSSNSKDVSHKDSHHSKESSKRDKTSKNSPISGSSASHSRDREKERSSERKERKEDRYKSEEIHKSKRSESRDKESRKKEEEEEEKPSSSSHRSNGEHRSKHKNKEKHKEKSEEKKSSSSRDLKRKNDDSDSKSSESSPTKVKVPKLLVDGIDSSMGTSFEEALGMISATSSTKSASKPIKTSPKVNPTSSSSSSSGVFLKPSSRSPTRTKTPPLLTSAVKLEPLDPSIALDLPAISPNYKPLPLNPTVMECVFSSNKPECVFSSNKQQRRLLSDEEAMSAGISSKTIRTKVYSGVKTGAILQVPTLFDLCIRVLQKNIDALEYTGGVPFEVLKPVLERATPQQLLTFEEFNPYLMEDSDALWKQHCIRNCRGKKREEMETWREMFLRCREEQERKLSMLAENIKQSQINIQQPVRKTQLAYVDSMVKPPRNVLRKQEQYGTKSNLIATPAARVAALSNITPNASRAGDFRLKAATSAPDTVQIAVASASANNGRPKKAPLMQKTIKFMKGRFRR